MNKDNLKGLSVKWQDLAEKIRQRFGTMPQKMPFLKAPADGEPYTLSPAQYKKARRLVAAAIAAFVVVTGVGIYSLVSRKRSTSSSSSSCAKRRHRCRKKWIRWTPSTRSCGPWSRAPVRVAAQKVTVA